MKRKKNEQHNKDWLDWWLSDDEAPPELDAKLRLPYAPSHEEGTPMFDTAPARQFTDEEPGAKNITVNLSLPKMKMPKVPVPEIKKPDTSWVKNLPRHDAGRLAIVAVGTMLFGLALHSFVFNSPPRQVAASGASDQVLAASTVGGPTQTISLSPSASAPATGSTVNKTSATSPSGARASFNPVAPSGKPQLGQYAFIQTSYDSAADTYTYLDTINNSGISVSEQPPNGYKTAQDAVNALATSVHATGSITTYAGTAHIYTDSSGKQTIIAPVAGLVITINSQATHSDAVWTAYLNNLR